MDIRYGLWRSLAQNRSPKFLPGRWTLGQLDMCLSALKSSYLAGSPNLEGNSMTEKLQRTEQVITEAELRTMLDEDDDSFADLIPKGVALVRGGAWRREQDGHWRFWRNPDWSPPDEDYP